MRFINTRRHERTAPAIPWSSFAFFHRKYNYQLLDYLLCSRLTFSLLLNSTQVWNTTLLIPILLPVYKASNTIWTSSQMLHLCLKKLTPSFNQDCIHIRKCLMPSMREHYSTDGIRISTTAISFFSTPSSSLLHLLRLLFLCFYERKLEVWNEKKIGRLVTMYQ